MRLVQQTDDEKKQKKGRDEARPLKLQFYQRQN